MLKLHSEGNQIFISGDSLLKVYSGDMQSAVALPKNEELHEWLATNTVDFFNEISLVYGTISDFCTTDNCPQMSAGPKFEYLWKDGKDYKTPAKKAAPEYIELLMRWVEEQLNNEEVFPPEGGTLFTFIC